MSLKFLNLKGWHPANKANQKRIWIAEQTAKDKEQREREAAAEVRKDADTRHYQEIAAARGDEDAARRMSSQQVGFLYAPPPGLLKDKEQETRERPDTEDEAVREFRRKVEKRGEGDAQRKLERYVGRRAEDPLTIKDQVERFPILKDAPVEGGYTDSVRVNFKPMGLQLRNVKCIRCGQWGHQSGDRECTLRDQNPHDAARQLREDPVTEINKLKSSKQELVLRRAALPLEMQGQAMGGEFEILQSDDDESIDPEKEFLASLSAKDKKRLLRKLKKQSREEASSSSSSDSEATSRHHSRKKRASKHKHKRRHKHRTREFSDERSGEEERTRRHHNAPRLPRSRSRSPERAKAPRMRSRSRSRERGERSRARHRHARRD